MVNDKESLEILRQNTKINQDLLEVRKNDDLPFDFGKIQLTVGQWIDVKDTVDHWLEAEVIDINEE